jgi:hypothetical protein
MGADPGSKRSPLGGWKNGDISIASRVRRFFDLRAEKIHRDADPSRMIDN